LHFGKFNREHFYLYLESTDNSTEEQLFLSYEQCDSEKLSRQHLPFYFTIHHLYSIGEHPVLRSICCHHLGKPPLAGVVSDFAKQHRRSGRDAA